MVQKTVLNERHRQLGAKMVDFGGWDMPLRYGSQVEEHHAVRQKAGMFDVSHMTVIDLHGAQTSAFLQKLLANNIQLVEQTAGKALYSCMLNEQGGIIDDLIAYYLDNENYRLVVNAATRDKDLAWIEKQAESFSVEVQEQTDLAMIAVQGPEARYLVESLLQDFAEVCRQLKPFQAVWKEDWFIARTGYTGEEGYEIILPAGEAEAFWNGLLEAGVVPCGLAARDTLRLEAGMNLYGSDMDESVGPFESGLGWTVAFEPKGREFIGRTTLEQARQKGGLAKFVGLVLQDKGVLRGHQKVIVEGVGEGEITSGGFSPTMNRSIAMARVPAEIGSECLVEIRGSLKKAKVVKPRFVRNGKILIDSE